MMRWIALAFYSHALALFRLADATATVSADGAVAPERVPMILIADPGVDDAAAILLAASAPSIDLVGVVTSFGCHKDVAVTTANAHRILRTAGKPHVPVCVGAARSLGALAPPPFDGTIVHGDDALGERADSVPPADGAPPPACPGNMTGVEFLVARARAAPGELLVAVLAPQTALALALQVEPRLPELVRAVHVMGGALAHAGNISPLAEANFANDALAARLVAADFAAKLTLFPLDLTHQAIFTAEHREALRRRGGGTSGAATFFADIVVRYQELYFKIAGIADGTPLHDAHTVAAALAPAEAMYEFADERLAVLVASEGDAAHGATLVDRRLKPSQVTVGEVTVRVARKVDAAAFVKLISAAIAALP